MGASRTGTARTFGAVLKDIGGNVDRLVRAELRYAIAQLRAEIGAAASASRIVAAGAVLAMFAAAFVLLAVMFALSRVMPGWLASLVVAAVAGAAAVVLIGIGRERFARQRTPPADDVSFNRMEKK